VPIKTNTPAELVCRIDIKKNRERKRSKTLIT